MVLHACIHTHSCVYTHAHMYMLACMHIHTQAHAHTHTHTFNICTNTLTYTYIITYVKLKGVVAPSGGLKMYVLLVTLDMFNHWQRPRSLVNIADPPESATLSTNSIFVSYIHQKRQPCNYTCCTVHTHLSGGKSMTISSTKYCMKHPLFKIGSTKLLDGYTTKIAAPDPVALFPSNRILEFL